MRRGGLIVQIPLPGIGIRRRLAAVGTIQEHVLATYRERARHYDITANLYYLLGFRVQASRRRAVRALALRPGDTVVEIGCGTGLNFSLVEQVIGPEGPDRRRRPDRRDACPGRAAGGGVRLAERQPGPGGRGRVRLPGRGQRDALRLCA